MIIKNCELCPTIIKTYPCRIKIGRYRFCKNCLVIIRKGKHNSPNTEFKKGENLADKHFLWKGENASYEAKHSWVYRRKGKAIKCENRKNKVLIFECSQKSQKYTWANKSHEYKRDLDDWIQLCMSCHQKYDMTQEKLDRLRAIASHPSNRKGIKMTEEQKSKMNFEGLKLGRLGNNFKK